jgi:hypothetical protein
VDGAPVKACTMLALEAEGAEVTTIEGMAAPDGTLTPLQAAFREHHGLQCGFCTPGMIMSAAALLKENAQALGDRGAPLARRQPLPLHGLPQHRQGRPGRSGVIPCTTSSSSARRPSTRPSKALAADDEAMALSGGQTLLPTMKQRLASPTRLVSLTGSRGCAAWRSTTRGGSA